MAQAAKAHPYYFSFTKRVFDVILSSSLLVLLSPLLLSISLLILITSGWPIFFFQQRMGKSRQPFTIIKFRIMYVGAEMQQNQFRKFNQAPAPMFKNWQDQRFVGVGRWLSKTGLDELPQLLNILKGEMSFVGPRPLPIAEAKKLPADWTFRYQAKPGIFSEWSVANNRHHSLAEWRALELKTLEQGGWWYELRIIWQTIRTIKFFIL